MIISKVKLDNFRNFRHKLLDFSDRTTVLVGPNAAGKTNILESIYLLSTGKSFKARVEEEMIRHDRNVAKVKGRVVFDSEIKDLEAILTRGVLDIPVPSGAKVARKKLSVNGVSKRLIDFAGNIKATLFGPWDLDLVTQSPSLRRRFLDALLSQVDREYRRSVVSYEKGLRQRNRLLFRIRGEGLSRLQLAFWNRLLVKNGDYITAKREEFISFANSTQNLDGKKFTLNYDRSPISEARLEQYAEEEVAAATTLVGPHRDDFQFLISDGKKGIKPKDLSSYGSRGEQRMAVLWLKLGELTFIEEKSSLRPVLLLDDIFSELDNEHRKIVMQASKKQQTIITTADPHFVQRLKGVEKILLKE